LHLELQSYFPLTLSEADLASQPDRDAVTAAVIADALARYDEKVAGFPDGLETAMVLERDILLQVIDTRWREHLSDMDYLKEGIHWRQVAQVDPLSAWQREGYQMFEQMLEQVRRDFVRFVNYVELNAAPEEPTSAFEGAVTNVETVDDESSMGTVTTAAPNAKIGRNEPCFCGSGKKFKQCHGRP